MAGASIRVLRLDDELRSLLDAPARTAGSADDGTLRAAILAAFEAIEAAREILGELEPGRGTAITG